MSVWKNGRLNVGLSQEELSLRTLCRREDIIDIEKGRKNPTPTQALLISRELEAPELTAHHCKHECAIGEVYCYNITKKPLVEATMELLYWNQEVQRHLFTVKKIVRDGVISPDEEKEAHETMHSIMMLEKAIEEYKLAMNGSLNIPQMVKEINEKTALAAKQKAV